MKCMFCFKVSEDAEEFATPTICKSCQASMSHGKPIDTTAHAHEQPEPIDATVHAHDEQPEPIEDPSADLTEEAKEDVIPRKPLALYNQESRSAWMPLCCAIWGFFLGNAHPVVSPFAGSYFLQVIIDGAVGSALFTGVWAFQGAMGMREWMPAWALFGIRATTTMFVVGFFGTGNQVLDARFGQLLGAAFWGFGLGLLFHSPFGRKRKPRKRGLKNPLRIF